MPPNESPQVLIEGAKLIFRNFTGLAREFNSEGDRNFSVLLEKDLAEKLKSQGWRVKQLKPRDGEEEGDYHMKVKVNYKTGRPPRCTMISPSSGNRTELGSEEISLFDMIEIKNADLILSGYWSDMAGGGFTPYLKTLFVTINEDELQIKYNDKTGHHEYDVKHQDPGDSADG